MPSSCTSKSSKLGEGEALVVLLLTRPGECAICGALPPPGTSSASRSTDVVVLVALPLREVDGRTALGEPARGANKASRLGEARAD